MNNEEMAKARMNETVDVLLAMIPETYHRTAQDGIKLLLAQQDAATRHACAEAAMSACMNVKAV